MSVLLLPVLRQDFHVVIVIGIITVLCILLQYDETTCMYDIVPVLTIFHILSAHTCRKA